MTTYYISRFGAPDLAVTYDGIPPCLWCGCGVTHPSMDGPLVCGLCDSGCIVDSDGSVRKWTDDEYAERKAHRKRVLDEIVAAQHHAEPKP